MKVRSQDSVPGVLVVYSGITPFDSLDVRIRKAMDAATVRRQKDGSYRATTPKLDLVFGEGETRKGIRWKRSVPTWWRPQRDGWRVGMTRPA